MFPILDMGFQQYRGICLLRTARLLASKLIFLFQLKIWLNKLDCDCIWIILKKIFYYLFDYNKKWKQNNFCFNIETYLFQIIIIKTASVLQMIIPVQIKRVQQKLIKNRYSYDKSLIKMIFFNISSPCLLINTFTSMFSFILLLKCNGIYNIK